MFSSVSSVALVLFAVFTQVHASPPCNSAQSIGVCAFTIRPYSDNAYTWTQSQFCSFNASSTALIAENVEFYDAQYGCSAPYIATCCARWSSCAIAVDCNGPETALPAYSVELPNNWVTAVPCAVDNADRVLANTIVTYQQNTTPYNCVSQCIAKGYQYAGVEYGDECYCGTGYTGGVLPQAADTSECDMVCPGSYGFRCGGSWRMQIYKAPGAP
ncbi:hypothetical protein BDW22DRAFT_660877 [Trametopsis cervina]|nr:hypothetical protein BDW22DRAFT_660877 [Trametopsis cervina]